RRLAAHLEIETAVLLGDVAHHDRRSSGEGVSDDRAPVAPGEHDAVGPAVGRVRRADAVSANELRVRGRGERVERAQRIARPPGEEPGAREPGVEAVLAAVLEDELHGPGAV